ncbi:MAG: NAD(P)-dependent glycerol-3-phosphate dehydrogenase [Gammaproteobacteria bacterium]|nr:NAD(P)-dependent glycerol-3-phosphate dehydrogenase [Gammaproteobacteria bacterium]
MAIAVLGAGSWGTALAVLLARNGVRTLLWGHDPGHMARLARDRENAEFLPGVPLPEDLVLSADLDAALARADDLLLVVPSQFFGDVLDRLRPALRPGTRVAWATKGLEPRTGRPLHEVVRERLGPEVAVAVLSGPTFAREVARGLPTAITVASPDQAFSHDLALAVHSPTFRVYVSRDVVGVEIGGSVKNVLAIAAGAADGLGFGANTRAALITRGLAEMMRLGVAAGGERETFMGLAGLGDLVLTCTDDQSRNRRMGLALARGASVREAEAEIGQVVEGVATTVEVERLAGLLGTEMPICHAVYRVLYQGVSPLEAVRSLLAREDAHPERA